MVLCKQKVRPFDLYLALVFEKFEKNKLKAQTIPEKKKRKNC